MPTPTTPQDKRYAVSLAFGEWDLVAKSMEQVAAALDPSGYAELNSPQKIAHRFTRASCNRIAAKIRAEIPELAK